VALSTPSVADVRLIIDTPVSDAVITATIADAALIVGRCSAVANYGTDVQQAIIKYVTAHLLSIRSGAAPGPLTSKSLGDASESYGGGATSGTQLAASAYGQQAILLDPTGCLATLGKTKAFAINVGSF